MPALAAISGLGRSELSRQPIGTARDLAIDAIVAAIADAGLRTADIDGLLITRSPSADPHSMPLHLRNDLALPPLALLSQVESEGTSVLQAVQYAALAVSQGLARHVVCVFADARINGAGSAAGYARAMELTGIAGWEDEQGAYGAVGAYAMEATRYLGQYGLGEEDLGAYAIACRAWACLNPDAFLRTPLSMADYLASRRVADPLKVADCAYAVNGAAAVVVSGMHCLPDANAPVVTVLGMGQGHPGEPGLGEAQAIDGARMAADKALRMAGVGRDEIAMLQFYDPFSSVGLQLLEGYGFCAPGQAGVFVRSGATAPGGRLPLNTGGGHLSGFYLQGMTPLMEAVAQLRGRAGERQVRRGPTLVGGVGGRMEYHAVLVLGHEEAA